MYTSFCDSDTIKDGILTSGAELEQVLRMKKLYVFPATMWALQSKLLYCITLIILVVTGQSLAAETLYVVLSLLFVLGYNMIGCVYVALINISEMNVSLARCKRFLLLDELEKLDHSKTTDTFTDVIDPGITLSNVTSKWDENVEQNTLQDISVSVKPGKLLAVIGPVGAGKTSLLMAILREIPLLSGEATVRGKIGYTGQIPWVFSSSLRQNILFGQKYDRVKYDRIIKVCALNKDLEIFPNGDGTLIGERGVSLSGGQRSRVSLARALYMNTDVYLLDDPLSAVDAAVGRHIFNKCIMGYLKDKPRILVTHQLQYLKEADEILVLKEGKMLAIGTFDELCESGIDFTSLLKREDDEGEADAISRDAVAHMSDVDVSRSFSHTSIPKLIDVGSTLSLDTIEFKPEPVQVQEEEARRSGAISMSVFRDYFKAGTNIVTFTFLVLLNIVAQASFNVSDWWLSYWVNNEEARSVKVSEQNALLEYGYNVTNVTIPEVDTHFYMYIYIGITLTVFVFGLLRALLFFKIAVLASQKLHDVMFSSMLRTQILFFDTNPVGRILNRFSKDVGHMDDLLPITFYDFIQCTMLALGIVLVAGIVNPWVFIPALPLIILLIMIRYFFIKTSRNIKRLEATTRSSVFSHLSASIHGLWTIRAFGVQDKFIEQFDSHQDIHTEAWFLFITTTRWLAVRLDWLCAIFVASVTFCSVFASESLDAGLVGLSVTYAMTLMGMFQWAVRQSAELENQMVSVERILEYSRLPSEAPLESDDKHCPPKSWPHHGIISAEKAQLRYSENAPNVLKDLNFYIYSEEKVGIVGRTGAGKSSLLTMLFRLVEPEGGIVIDGIDIKNIGLHDLREKISIIPQTKDCAADKKKMLEKTHVEMLGEMRKTIKGLNQDPVLFTGTVRTNLDPFMQHADTGLWTALEEVQLKRVIEELPGGLDWAVSESGINFSVGQRQLLCLARAILRQNKILIIDEATANVDVRTDMLIQQTIRDKFRFCTVLTIAHRLHTIMDSDRVMVLEEGRIVQFEHPYTLLQNKHGHFYKTVEQTGRVEQERLIAIAKQSHDKSKRDTTSLFTADSIPLMDGSLPSPSLQINSAPQSTSNTGLRSRGLKNPAVDHHLAPLAEPDMFNSRDQLDTGSTEQDRLLHSLTNSVNI